MNCPRPVLNSLARLQMLGRQQHLLLLLNQAAHSVRWLRAFADPVLARSTLNELF